jgi:hypothetical protein
MVLTRHRAFEHMQSDEISLAQPARAFCFVAEFRSLVWCFFER